MSNPHRIDPRVRALGKARLDVIRRASDEREFQKLWLEARFPFPFAWGQGWKHNMQYYADDFAAEVGFYIDVLGFPVQAFSSRYAQFTGPEQDFFFTVAAATEDQPSTPPDVLRLQFQISNLPAVLDELENRGVAFETSYDKESEGAPYASFRTPHGILVEILGEAVQRDDEDSNSGSQNDEKAAQSTTPLESFWAEDEWEDDEDEDSSDEQPDRDEQEEEIIFPAVPATRNGPSSQVIEVTYEDIADEDDDELDEEYEEEQEPLPVKREPAPSLVTRGREPLSPQRSRLPSSDLRQLDIPLDTSLVIRKRRHRHDGAVQFPVRENRDRPWDD